MNRWPRTLILGMLLLCAVATIAIMFSAVALLGINGPLYVGALGFVYILVAAIRGDVKDQEKP